MAQRSRMKDRTIDCYLEAAAKLRLLKTLYGSLVTSAAILLPVEELHEIQFLQDHSFPRIDYIFERHFSQDHPEVREQIGPEWLRIFDGWVTVEPWGDMDTQVQELARKIADGLKKSVLGTKKELQPAGEWFPIEKKAAEFPCLACDEFGQIFIPQGIVVANGTTYDSEGLDLDDDESVLAFLKGKKFKTSGGATGYELPRRIVAWMPLPESYKVVKPYERRKSK